MGKTIEEFEQQKKDYQRQKFELEMKEKMGMPMSEDDLYLYERIDGLIDQMDWIIDYMMLENEDEYEWDFGIN